MCLIQNFIRQPSKDLHNQVVKIVVPQYPVELHYTCTKICIMQSVKDFAPRCSASYEYQAFLHCHTLHGFSPLSYNFFTLSMSQDKVFSLYFEAILYRYYQFFAEVDKICKSQIRKRLKNAPHFCLNRPNSPKSRLFKRFFCYVQI